MEEMKKILFLAALLSCSSGFARVEETNVGKKLPPLNVDYVSNAPGAVAGKPMLVEFWATWCGPCRQTIPHLNEVYKSYKDRGLVVIGISSEGKSKISEFMKTLPMNYSVASDSGGKFSGQFGITGIPHAFLVNAAGQIVWEGHPMSLKGDEIEKVLTAGASPAAPSPAPPVLPAAPPAGKKYY